MYPKHDRQFKYDQIKWIRQKVKCMRHYWGTTLQSRSSSSFVFMHKCYIDMYLTGLTFKTCNCFLIKGVMIEILICTLLVCLFVCLSVHMYPINVKTAEPIGPEFFVGPRLTLGEGLWMIEFSNDIFMSETRVYNNQNTRLCTSVCEKQTYQVTIFEVFLISSLIRGV